MLQSNSRSVPKAGPIIKLSDYQGKRLSVMEVKQQQERSVYGFAVGDFVKSTTHFHGIKDGRCYNDVPKGTVGEIISLHLKIDKKNPGQGRKSATVRFNVKLDESFKAKHPKHWEKWFPREHVEVTHQTTCENITPYNT